MNFKVLTIAGNYNFNVIMIINTGKQQWYIHAVGYSTVENNKILTYAITNDSHRHHAG